MTKGNAAGRITHAGGGGPPSLVFEVNSGRGRHHTALQMLWHDPRIARGVLKRLASIKPSRWIHSRAQPGKITPTKMGGGEMMRRVREVAVAHIYGS